MSNGIKVIDPGHLYQLDQLDLHPMLHPRIKQELCFVKRMGEKYPGNDTAYAGTTMQFVIRALLDRARYVQNQTPCAETKEVIWLLQQALMQLERRAARVHNRKLPSLSLNELEAADVCEKCGHVFCEHLETQK
jgi:hypothetical protein